MTELLTPSQLREQGFGVLVQSLGWVNAVRFIQQYETSTLDYTKERDSMLPDWSADEMISQIENLKIPPQPK